MSEAMEVTEHGVGYIKITEDIIKKYDVDVASPGNLINNFNNIEEIIVWLAITEDTKNNIFKVNIRSRGPVINKIAENYNGGGHKLAAGAKVMTLAEADKLIKELDKTCLEYIKEKGEEV